MDFSPSVRFLAARAPSYFNRGRDFDRARCFLVSVSHLCESRYSSFARHCLVCCPPKRYINSILCIFCFVGCKCLCLDFWKVGSCLLFAGLFAFRSIFMNLFILFLHNLWVLVVSYVVVCILAWVRNVFLANLCVCLVIWSSCFSSIVLERCPVL